MLVLLLLVLSPACLSAGFSSVPPRSTWLAIQAHTVPNITASDMSFFASVGITRLYVDVWNDGTVYFNSPTMDALVPNGGAFGGDFLKAMVALAADHGIEVVAWLEYGFMAAYGVPNNFTLAASSKGWMLGKTANDFLYLDPSNNGVLGFISGLMTDLLAGYMIRGVQLDDHFDCPVMFSTCSVEVMNAAASYVHLHVGPIAQSLGKIVSIAPTTADWALSMFSVDWPAWMRSKLFDEIAVQLYYSDASSFSRMLNSTLNQLPAEAARSIFSAGVRVSGDPLTPWPAAALMLSEAAAQEVPVVVWYSDSILSKYRQEFAKIWG